MRPVISKWVNEKRLFGKVCLFLRPRGVKCPSPLKQASGDTPAVPHTLKLTPFETARPQRDHRETAACPRYPLPSIDGNAARWSVLRSPDYRIPHDKHRFWKWVHLNQRSGDRVIAGQAKFFSYYPGPTERAVMAFLEIIYHGFFGPQGSRLKMYI